MTFDEWWETTNDTSVGAREYARLVWTAARAAFVADVRKRLKCRCGCWPDSAGVDRRVPNPNCPWHVYAVKLLTEEEFKSC